MAENTDIGEITQAVEDKLLAKIIIDEVVIDVSQIIWAVDEFPPHVKGNYDIVLRPSLEQNVMPVDDGGGRQALRCSQILDIFVRTSSGLAVLGNDKVRILKQVAVERAVLDALAGKMLANASGLDLLTMPLKWRNTSAASKDKQVAAKNLWERSGLSFEVHYRPLIDPSDYT